jgi:hypothetical protein
LLFTQGRRVDGNGAFLRRWKMQDQFDLSNLLAFSPIFAPMKTFAPAQFRSLCRCHVSSMCVLVKEATILVDNASLA